MSDKCRHHKIGPDVLRRIHERDIDPSRTATAPIRHSIKVNDSLSPTPSEAESGDYFPEQKAPEKMAFWKRKPSSSGLQSPSGGIFKRSVSAQVGAASPGAVPPVPPLPSNASINGSLAVPKRNGRASTMSYSSYTSHTHEESVHDNCMALLKDLDAVVKISE